jgi:hypothetical protein
MISIAYTEKETPLYASSTNREYIEDIPSWKKAEQIVKKLIKEGHYNIFIDKFDRDNNLIDYKGFNWIENNEAIKLREKEMKQLEASKKPLDDFMDSFFK